MAEGTVTEQVYLRRHTREPELRAEVSRRQSHLLGLGFAQGWISSLMEERPTLYDPIVVDNHILGLRERGFSDPKKMIESFPPILSLAFENINAKLKGLKKRGFSDPNKMIESLPTILGLDFKNIDRRLRLIGSIVSLYDVPFKAVQLMESHNALFSSKLDKLVVLTRVLKKFVDNPQEVSNAIVNKLLFSNLEDVLVAVDMAGARENLTINEFIELVKEVKAAEFSKEEKQRAIERGLQRDPKIRSRYLKGYSKDE